MTRDASPPPVLAEGPAPVAELDREAADRMWRAYLAQHPLQAWDTPTVEHFGDSAAMADELLGIVLAGGKRATAALLRDFADLGELPPRIASHWVACDGAGAPRVVLRSVELRVGTADSVDDRFARDEGEGDEDREQWLVGHGRYWTRQLAALGEPWDPTTELVVFERFEVVWPPEHAD
ncbi:ASCH domain-containing protein [Jannaschia sp. R86511]|uniref:ASCH domain-containing protein n=1 Tax=Jannaschia sp. R86511 TaxID=3093853 RepID=UPI0036D27BCB